jgi:hypothetical protein
MGKLSSQFSQAVGMADNVNSRQGYNEDDLQPMTPAFQPGLYTEATDRQATLRFKDGDKVRFFNGLPQKLFLYLLVERF